MTARRSDTMPMPTTSEATVKTETTPETPKPKMHLIAASMVAALEAGDYHLARLFMANLPVVRPGERWVADEAQASEVAT